MEGCRLPGDHVVVSRMAYFSEINAYEGLAILRK
jgi:hypothetical protein